MTKAELRIHVMRVLNLNDYSKATEANKRIDYYIGIGMTNVYWIVRRVKEDLGIK